MKSLVIPDKELIEDWQGKTWNKTTSRMSSIHVIPDTSNSRMNPLLKKILIGRFRIGCFYRFFSRISWREIAGLLLPSSSTMSRSTDRLPGLSSSSLSRVSASAATAVSSTANPNPTSPTPPSPPSSSSPAVRHLSDWRSPLSHRAAVRSSAAVAERFERSFSSMATRNAYEGILTPLSKPGGGEFGKYYSLPALNDPRIDRLPYSIRILLESAIRNCDDFQVKPKDVEKIVDWENTSPKQVEIPFKPARVLLQDFTGVPAVVDLACMRDAMNRLGGDSNKINPLVPVDLVIDHSVQVDVARSENAVQANMELEFSRNKERFGFLKWGSNAFHNMLVVPPGSGIVHQVNLEYLGRVVFNRDGLLYPDSVVGTDSHTTMIDGLGVAGWGVGGIEAEAAMLGQPMSMVLPGVVGFRLSGRLKDGVTATDLVLTVTQILRKHGVVGKFVEFYGEGMSELSLADRATIANMSPEYGATMGFFPVDHVTLQYLKLTGRSDETPQTEKVFSSYLELNLEDVEPCISGPKRPHDRVTLKDMKADWHSCLDNKVGFKVKPWIKTSLAPGSGVVKKYLEKSDLQKYLNQLGFHIVGYGCTTCIGNSGDLDEAVAAAISDNDIIASAVLSGNRNFEGRVHPLTRANYLASPPLVVAYALAGTVNIDFDKEPIGTGKDGKDVFFRDIWPSNEEIAEPPYFKEMTMSPPGPHSVKNAYCLLNFGDSITTDHISPAGSIHKDSPAAKYLMDRGVDRKDFNSYGSRRGNDEIMARGTFANIRIVNKLLKGEVGPKTIHIPSGEKLSVFDAALGVKAVIAKSFERIHRSNLVGMGIIPLCFKSGEDVETLGLTGHERYNIDLPSSVSEIKPGQDVTVTTDNGKSFTCTARFDTEVELEYFNHGGILPYVIRNLIGSKQ
ncbi:hypothetical protein QJS10_CPA01g00345 [Acorus calamus]|uniref:aconitate hydratase n=1 Tax=Acorus calamus TaxID=4465 RepID=A0AAV9FMB0_ACOCL|nr:hypothetical protein QJS10_CPA01g00345 [Acorus calamus]